MCSILLLYRAWPGRPGRLAGVAWKQYWPLAWLLAMYHGGQQCTHVEVVFCAPTVGVAYQVYGVAVLDTTQAWHLYCCHHVQRLAALSGMVTGLQVLEGSGLVRPAACCCRWYGTIGGHQVWIQCFAHPELVYSSCPVSRLLLTAAAATADFSSWL